MIALFRGIRQFFIIIVVKKMLKGFFNILYLPCFNSYLLSVEIFYLKLLLHCYPNSACWGKPVQIVDNQDIYPV